VSLRDKLRELRDAPAGLDLLEFFGVGPDGLRLTPEGLTVGGESVPLAEARAVVLGGPIRTGDAPPRRITIGDLPHGP
jgi:hypothetical protein